MSSTQERLDAYKAAELRILQRGQSTRFDVRQKDEAALESIRKAISQLETQLVTEQRGAAGLGSLSYSVASFNRCGRGLEGENW